MSWTRPNLLSGEALLARQAASDSGWLRPAGSPRAQGHPEGQAGIPLQGLGAAGPGGGGIPLVTARRGAQPRSPHTLQPAATPSSPGGSVPGSRAAGEGAGGFMVSTWCSAQNFILFFPQINKMNGTNQAQTVAAGRSTSQPPGLEPSEEPGGASGSGGERQAACCALLTFESQIKLSSVKPNEGRLFILCVAGS